MADGSVRPLISACIMQRRSSNQESFLGFFCAGQAEPYQEYLFFSPSHCHLNISFPWASPPPPAALLIISCPHPSSFYFFIFYFNVSSYLALGLTSLGKNTKSCALTHHQSGFLSITLLPSGTGYINISSAYISYKKVQTIFSSSTPNLLRLVLFSSFHHLNSPSPIC